MRRPRLAPVIFSLVTSALVGVSLFAQPSMTSISPNYGGGNGANSPSNWTVTGSGFSTAPKGTRFVDNNNVDLFSYVTCSTTTSCDAYGVFGNRVAAGAISNIAIFALVNGLKSASFAGFIYYGSPIVTSVTPNSAPSTGVGGITITGSGFSSGVSYPGTTSIYLQSYISDRTSGCTSTTQCTGVSAPSLSVGVKTGPNNITFLTPGGYAAPVFTYTPALSTPTITSISPNKGPSAGGTLVTITGTNFVTAAGGTTFTFSMPGNQQSIVGTCPTTTSCTLTTTGGYGIADVTVMTQNATSFSANSTVTTSTRFTYAGYNVGWPDGRLMTNISNTYLPTSENGGSTQVTLALNTAPTSTVTVALSATTNGGVRGVVSPPSMSFTTSNWNLPQVLTATGVDDNGLNGAPAQATGNFGFSVNAVASSSDAAFNGIQQQLNFTNYDNDAAGYYLSRTAQLVSTKNGGTATTQMALLKAPASTVTVTLTSSNPLNATVSPGSMTFDSTSGGATSWNTPRTITMTGLNDGITGNTPYMIIVKATTADAAYSALGHPPDLYPTNALLMPTNLTALAASGTSVVLGWSSVSGADGGYQVLRTSGSGYALVGRPTTTSFTDTSASPNTAYLYRVRAVSADIASSDSAWDLATTIMFTDDPVVANTTVIKAAHVTELRTAINLARVLAGLAAVGWTDNSPAGVAVKASHVNEMRTALGAARSTLGLTAMTYTYTPALGLPVRAIDLNETRSGVK